MGRSPRSTETATRSGRSSGGSGGSRVAPGSGSAVGAMACGPAMAPSSSATSATVRATGPSTDSRERVAMGPVSGTRPTDGRSPTTPQNAGGLRSEPPRSLPSASAAMPHATATAAPPLEPPHERPVSHGLRVVPNTGLNVCEPAPNSGVLLLPSITEPAARMRATIRSSTSGTKSANAGEPNVVRTPAVSTRSLCTTGRPCSGPTGAPVRASSSSSCPARRSAESGVRVTTAFTAPSTASMRARCAATTSRADTWRVRIRSRSATALRSTSSSSTAATVPAPAAGQGPGDAGLHTGATG